MRMCKVTAGNSEKQMIECFVVIEKVPSRAGLWILRITASGCSVLCIHFINWSKQSQFGSLCKLVEWLECDINGEIKHMMKNKSCRCMIKREMFRLPPLG